MDRTTLIANTSNMPVAAREASIYTGITLAEYYRDMGYHVAIMADSTSRWAEALRELSGRLEEMPAEEGFPAYLPSRLSEFYERAGYVETLNGREGSVTIIGAVSPQGSDFSEPVTQNTKRFVRCFWALDKNLAYARHYPAINWNMSYSEYSDDLAEYYNEHVGEEFCRYRQEISTLLVEENNLMEIVKLIGADVLPDDQKLIIEIARVIRVGFLQQNAFHKDDTFVPLEKQKLMMKAILLLYHNSLNAINGGKPISEIISYGFFDKLIKMKYDIPNDKLEMFDEYFDMCRMGIVTYGLYPSEEVDKSLLDIEPIMSWYTKISHIKELEPKREISYGGTFITEKTTKVATIPIGYAVAFPRCLSNKGKVIINGKYAIILCRVCMDQFMVDVSDIDCIINDEVVIVGTQKGAHISIEELSDSAYSFNYELPCSIPARVNRVYVYNDEVVEDVGLV